jgi:hypothetical protein
MFRKERPILDISSIIWVRGLAIAGIILIVIGVIGMLFIRENAIHTMIVPYTPPTSTSSKTSSVASTTSLFVNHNYPLIDTDFSLVSTLLEKDFNICRFGSIELVSKPFMTIEYNSDFINRNMSNVGVDNRNAMDMHCDFGRSVLVWRSNSLSLLTSSPDGWNGLSSLAILSSDGVMTPVPRTETSANLRILSADGSKVKVNISHVGSLGVHSLELNPDQTRLYVGYNITDNIQGQSYSPDIEASAYESTEYVNQLHILCGAVGYFSWNTISLSWDYNSSWIHPFGSQRNIVSLNRVNSDFFGEQIRSWFLPDVVNGTNQPMVTISGFTCNEAHPGKMYRCLFTYKEMIDKTTLTTYYSLYDVLNYGQTDRYGTFSTPTYSSDQAFDFGKTFYVGDEYIMVMVQNEIWVYKWQHNMIQDITASSSKTILCYLLQKIPCTSGIWMYRHQVYDVLSIYYQADREIRIYNIKTATVQWELSFPFKLPTTFSGCRYLYMDITGTLVVMTDTLNQLAFMYLRHPTLNTTTISSCLLKSYPEVILTNAVPSTLLRNDTLLGSSITTQWLSDSSFILVFSSVNTSTFYTLLYNRKK